MRRVGFLVLCAFLVGLMSIPSTNGQQYLNLTVADLTPCGFNCVISAIKTSGCRFEDTSCQCTSQKLAQSTSQCMNTYCTMHDGLVAVKVNASLCRKPLGQSRSDMFLAVIIVVYSTAVMFVALRFVTKAMKRTRGTVDWSDWFLLFAVLCAIPSVYYCVKSSREGFGKHFWELEDVYVAENVYVIQLAIPKLSILFFYIRSIPNEGFHQAVFLTMFLIVISTTIISTLTIVDCYPIAAFWDRDLSGHCININNLGYATGSLSIVQDLLIISLPIPILKGMMLPRREKIQVLFMFAVGSSSVVISILRVQSIIGFRDSLDPSWDYIIVVIWSLLEVYGALITASLPTIRQLLVIYFPRTCAMARPHRQVQSAPTGVSWFRRRGVPTMAPQLPTLEFSRNSFTGANVRTRDWQRMDYGAPFGFVD
ncbi:hypothetical protein BKA61DRAFT_669068 [Leptodontidium sp. MPI-SDFR-AT-0119]|nr:hypothetical protein BKA61DRAFT_669068 [Leptodontidium sp. MPI-SDFR-AT-0119]